MSSGGRGAENGVMFGGSVSRAGAGRGLQNRWATRRRAAGGFDSHALPLTGRSTEFHSKGGRRRSEGGSEGAGDGHRVDSRRIELN